MVWKYNLVNKFNNNNIYLNSRIISQIITFLLKKDLYLLYFRKKKIKFSLKKKYNTFLDLELHLRKSVKNFMRKIFYSQLRITRLSEWFIINVIIFNTFKSKDKILIKTNEVYFRLRHYYHYLTPKINQFKMNNLELFYCFILCLAGLCKTLLFFFFVIYVKYIIYYEKGVNVDSFVNYLHDCVWAFEYYQIHHYDAEPDSIIYEIYALVTLIHKRFWFAIIELTKDSENKYVDFLYHYAVKLIRRQVTITLVFQYVCILAIFLIIISLSIWSRASGPRLRPDQLLVIVTKAFLISLMLIFTFIMIMNMIFTHK